MQDWITGFVDYTRQTGSPALFRKWAAISILAAAMERKVWVWTKGSPLYSNMYVVLCGPPGVGKSEITWRASTLIRALPKHHVAHTSLTKAALIDTLHDARVDRVNPNAIPAVQSFNSLYVCSDELGVLLPAYDGDFMNALTHIYDCKEYSERRRTKDLLLVIPKPQLNILAACTSSYLINTLPEVAWDQGFTSRTLFIYAGESESIDLFLAQEEFDDERDELARRLKTIGELYGQIEWTEEAMSVIRAWVQSGLEPKPDHPRMLYYCTRRVAHALKVAMCVMVSESGQLIMQAAHIQRAIDLLVEFEYFLPEIFKSGSSSHSRVIEDTWHYVFRTYSKENKKPVAASRIYAFIGARVPAHMVEQVLRVMENSGLLIKGLETTGTVYRPAVKER